MNCAALVLAIVVVSSAALAQRPWEPDEFPIGFWAGPPADRNTLEDWQTVADCNFTFGMGSPDYGVEGNKRMLDYCAEVGIRGLVIDERANWRVTEGDNWRDILASLVADYRAHPGLYGYYVHDEPSYSLFPALAMVSQELGRLDPDHLAYINLFPTYANTEQLGTPTYSDHLDKYLNLVRPAVLSYDHYCLMKDGTDRPDYFENLALIREYGLLHGVPPWNIILSWPHMSYRAPSEGEMRWQVYTSLAYGMKGIMYFIYWTLDDALWPWDAPPIPNAIVDKDGRPAELYPVIRQLNHEMKTLGKTLLRLWSTGVYHTGPTPLGCTRLGSDAPIQLPDELPLVIGFFVNPDGSEHYAMVVNNKHGEPVEFDAVLKPHVVGMEEISAEDGLPRPAETEGGRLRLRLEPGGGRLFRISTSFLYFDPPKPVEEIAFDFDSDDDIEGWGTLNSLVQPTVRGGILELTFSGADPYLSRAALRIEPDRYSTVRVRMKLPPCNAVGQLFWTTSDSPLFADDKHVAFPVEPDGAWHEYEIPVGDHQMWRGRQIRAIRLDPTTGGAAAGSTVQIDWIRGG